MEEKRRKNCVKKKESGEQKEKFRSFISPKPNDSVFQIPGDFTKLEKLNVKILSGGSNQSEERITENSDVPKKDVKAATPADDAQSRIQAARERFLARKGNKALISSSIAFLHCLEFNACSIVVGTSLEYNDEIKAIHKSHSIFVVGYSVRFPAIVHCLVCKYGLSFDLFVANGLIDMYCKCGCLRYARKVFDETPQRDVVSRTNMISGYSNLGRVHESRVLFERMGLEGVEGNEFTWNALITGYARVGDCDEAFSLFRKMSEAGLVPDVATWNAIISGFVQS
nr:hypothetical protein [Tanacetum cinerariifolium]